MTNALELKGVGKVFSEFTLKDISFSLPEGYIMGLIGPNGSGKTTTVKLILNMLGRDAGEISVFGMDNLGEEKGIKQHTGIVFDSTFFVDEWRVKDVERAISGFYKSWDSARYQELLGRFDLSLEKRIKELSRGMQMKLMLSCALAHDAKLLILDEPTSGLDPVARAELLELLQEYIQDGKKSVLFSTHITMDLERIADYITFIYKGGIVYTGTKDDFLESHRIVRGKPDTMSAAAREKITGLRKTGGSFDGMIRTKDAALFSGCVIDEATIDDIMVYTGRENEK